MMSLLKLYIDILMFQPEGEDVGMS